THDSTEPRTLRYEGQVHPPLQLDFHLAQLRLHPPTRCAPMQEELPSPCLRADMREAQEIEGLWLSDSTFLTIRCREGTEFDQASFVGVQLQRELAQSPAKLPKEP